ncbi:MAG: cytochrome C oxidase subunit IV family protein [Armatimonadetes bacterium]|nr:cytochrome C oxidase subunit IV family protein [Armatimonadota bacterium]
MADAHDKAHEGGYKVYVVTWFWLLVLTVLEIGVVLTRIPRLVMVLCLISLALLKAVLIAAYFMHLRFERISLAYIVTTPLILATILFFALVPDATRVLGIR